MSNTTSFNTTRPACRVVASAVWRKAFLAAFCLSGNASEAARAAQVDRTTVYKAKGRDAAFAAEWAAAEEVASSAQLRAALQRSAAALLPTTETHSYEVTTADGLLLAAFKTRLPSLFGQQPAATSPASAAPSYDLSRLSPRERQQLVDLTRKATIYL
jgi:hypothetical protein